MSWELLIANVLRNGENETLYSVSSRGKAAIQPG